MVVANVFFHGVPISGRSTLRLGIRWFRSLSKVKATASVVAGVLSCHNLW